VLVARGDVQDARTVADDVREIEQSGAEEER